MSRITFQIEYAGITLTVGKNAAGADVTPLKPIADLFGLNWETQRMKVTEAAYYREYLGICTRLMGGADRQKRERTCIRIDRVAAYLMTLNPERIKANGNEDGAAYLMRKQEEWADALHDYESLGVAVNLNHQRAQKALRAERLALLRAVGTLNNTRDAVARQSVLHLIGQMCNEQGVPFQPQLPVD